MNTLDALDAQMLRSDIPVHGLPSDRVGQHVVVQVPVGQRRAEVQPRRFVATRYGVFTSVADALQARAFEANGYGAGWQPLG